MEKCQVQLQQGLQQLKIAYDDHKIDSLLAFIKLMEKWNKAYNLTAVRNLEDMVFQHLLDSLSILPYIQGKHVADIGTGAGLPGIPLAVFLPDINFTLVDSNAKKTRFVQQAVLELSLNNVSVQHCRIEKFQPPVVFSTLVLRAFADLQKIMFLTQHLQTEKSIILAMKGQIPRQELNNITTTVTTIPLTIPGMEAKRCLIRIKR